jgi:hypothetical protein
VKRALFNLIGPVLDGLTIACMAVMLAALGFVCADPSHAGRTRPAVGIQARPTAEGEHAAADWYLGAERLGPAPMHSCIIVELDDAPSVRLCDAADPTRCSPPPVPGEIGPDCTSTESFLQ